MASWSLEQWAAALSLALLLPAVVVALVACALRRAEQSCRRMYAEAGVAWEVE
ncbi:MAG: hypothetical protein VX494_04120 [Actinomycetota bacterium]|nr:hypothetical protein [Actinomycetota bacterium]